MDEDARGDAEDAFEVGGEMTLVAEAGLGGDFGDFEVGGQEQFAGAVDAASDQVLMRGQAGGAFEEAGEVVGAEAGGFGDLLETEFFAEVGLHEFDGFTEAVTAQAAVVGGGIGGVAVGFGGGVGVSGVVGGGGVAADEMDGEGAGERFSVPTTAGAAGFEFGLEGERETADEGVVVDGAEGEFELVDLRDVVGGAAEELGFDGKADEVAGVAVAHVEGAESRVDTDIPRGDVGAAGTFAFAPFEGGGFIQLDQHLVPEWRFVIDFGGASLEVVHTDAFPRSFGAGKDRRPGHVRAAAFGTGGDELDFHR